MQHDNMETDEYDDHEHAGNPFGRWFNKLLNRGSEEAEEFEDEDIADQDHVAHVPQPSRAAGGAAAPLRRSSGTTLRMETARRSRVTVRRTVQSFDDVQRAVDGLREGTQQIINLEQTASDMAARLIDFLNGATYAIDGAAEKIGEHVYLFTPASVTVDFEERAAPTGTRTPFFDK